MRWGGEGALWMVDLDYDGWSLFDRQVFVPKVGAREGWAGLARNLKAESGVGLLKAYRGTRGLPFETGNHARSVVQILDDRGVERLKIVEWE